MEIQGVGLLLSNLKHTHMNEMQYTPPPCYEVDTNI